jgi:hypothetical protein
VIFYAALLLASGFIAGMVSSEVRRHVAAALHEAEVKRRLKQVEHELEIARFIQQSLLPRIRPTVNGLEISGWNLPADATGGDYFDWKEMRDGRVVVMLAHPDQLLDLLTLKKGLRLFDFKRPVPR